jgi:beta-N-acetylhexosaminidase
MLLTFRFIISAMLFFFHTPDKIIQSTEGAMSVHGIHDYYDFTAISPETEKKISEMTLREKIAQMIISSSDGFALDENSVEFQRLRNLVINEKIGGFIFFKGNSVQEAGLINKLQQLSETPLLMSADFERGTRMRLDDGSLYPNNMALGATRDPELAYKMGYEIAKECRAIGIHQNYAPVVDVNNNSLNPIINVRSFGEDPKLVCEMGDKMVKGIQDANVIATAKHFPGHGDTEIDSHSDLPVLNLDMPRLESVELPPFKSAIEAGVMSVMIAHLSFPAVDDESNVPASLSTKLIGGLLQDKLGFKGLVVTDALNMAGVVKHFSTEEVALRCVNAGVDLILMPQGETRTIDAIEGAVLNGSISEERINSSVRKILNAKQWLKLYENKIVDESIVSNIVNSADSKALAREIANKSITLVKNSGDVLPFTEQQQKKCLIISMNNGNEKANSDYFLKTFKETNQFSELSFYDLSGDITNTSEIISDAAGYDLIIIPIYAKVKIKTGTVGLPSSQLDLINGLTASSGKICIISFGNPYLIQGFPEVGSYVCAYSDSEVSIEAAVDAAFGKIKFTGKLPVTISNNFGFGHGITN